MKKIIPILSFAFLLGAQTMSAQDYDDTNIASHDLEVTIDEIALLDVHDANAGVDTEAGIVKLEISNTGDEQQEAGLYDFTDFEVTNFYLNYTSVVSETAGEGSGLNTSRNISAKLLADSALPGSTKLVITALDPLLSNANNGTAGTLTSSSFEFKAADITTGASQILVQNIGSVYTGDGAYGVKLTYNLEQDGDFSNFKAGTFTSTIQYTLSDL